MVEDDNLLERGVGGEGFRGEIGGDPTAEIFVVLAGIVGRVGDWSQKSGVGVGNAIFVPVSAHCHAY